jgi:predicted RNase H-like HicB family nuclease
VLTQQVLILTYFLDAPVSEVRALTQRKLIQAKISKNKADPGTHSASSESQTVEKIVNLHIEKLPEGVYLATSDDVPGLVAQGRTITETLEIARDVAKKLSEAQLKILIPDNIEIQFYCK